MRDLNAAAAFCEQHLGLRRAAVSPPHAVVFDTEPAPFAVRELLPGVDFADTARPGLGAVLWFQTSDAHRLHDQLTAAGIKMQRLHALAEAALDGTLDATHLRALPTDHALAELRTLPGIGPFSAELILIGGAGHPDVFPRHEPRVHKAVATAYGLGAPTTDDDVTQLAKIADRWKPYRSWVAFLLRVRAGDTSQPGPVCHGSPPPS